MQASNRPLVSIITPVYNAEKYLKYAVMSVIEQTYQNWELLLIDDNSTDFSRQLMEEFSRKDERIKAHYLSANCGAAIARNKGIDEACGTIIAFLDADDLWRINKLEIQVKFMVDNKFAFTYCYYDCIDEDGNNLNKTITAPATINYNQLLKNNTIGCLTVAYNCALLGKLVMPNIRKRQDWGHWLNLLKIAKTGYCINQSLADYRITKNSLSHKKLKTVKYNWIILRKFQKLSFFNALYHFLYYIISKSFNNFFTKNKI